MTYGEKGYMKINVEFLKGDIITIYNDDKSKLIKTITGTEAEILRTALISMDSLGEILQSYRLYPKKGEDDMRFQIIDNNGNVVDKDLSYESALMYIDSVVGKYYIMQPMKEEEGIG